MNVSIEKENKNEIIQEDKRNLKNKNTINKQILNKEANHKKKSEYSLPTRSNYEIIHTEKYTIKQLKEIAGNYKIKLSSSINKPEIKEIIYNYFKNYDKATIIQKACRKLLLQRYNKLRGPARIKRELCVNESDFFTMDSVTEIPYLQFFSYKTENDVIYGFDIMSLYNLYDKQYGIAENPYTREPFPRGIKKKILRLLRLSRLFNEKINVNINEDEKINTIVKTPFEMIEYRAISVFHDIDILGNYTDYTWFLTLDHYRIVRFVIELIDIWLYRANISNDIKTEICPNHADLFHYISHSNIHILDSNVLFDNSLRIIERLVRDGINRESRCLGANFVLCALTLVSPAAAEALPWLYQSVI